MKIAIIGFGPRGLHSLECVVKYVVNSHCIDTLKVLVFDSANALGSGIAWQLEQPDSNWMNISHRALKDLNGRAAITTSTLKIPEFPCYNDWYVLHNSERYNENKDKYPPRSVLGRYLNERALSILEPLRVYGVVNVIKDTIVDLNWEEHQFKLTSKSGDLYQCDTCLLTVGHTTTIDSEEVEKNRKHALESNTIYINNPYKETVISKAFKAKNVAIIGIGLSMLDIMRMLTIGLGGSFTEAKNNLLKFHSTENLPKAIIPYSFDGLPCVPKPFGSHIDKQFMPTNAAIENFEKDIRNAVEHNFESVKAKDFIHIIADLGAQVYRQHFSYSSCQNLSDVFYEWILNDEDNHSEFLDKSLPMREYILKTIAMACGDIVPSFDYFIGQLWRHLQPSMYRVFAFSRLKGKVIKELIAIDERIKRYSYGPPVESMKQMVALIDAGLLITDYVCDPEIIRTECGWKFSKDRFSITSQVLINSVMDNPELEKMNSPLLKSLKQQKLVVEVYQGLGIKTDAFAKVENGKNNIPLYVIGRNAKGSILGADAILECFSPDVEVWAKHLLMPNEVV